MDLACKENISPTIYAEKDPVILRDLRALENLLRDERFYTADKNYFEDVQTDIAPFMRKVVTMWMFEVSRNFICDVVDFCVLGAVKGGHHGGGFCLTNNWQFKILLLFLFCLDFRQSKNPTLSPIVR